jgi:hypothetical protein
MYADPGFCDQKTYVVLARDLVRGQTGGDEAERPSLFEWPAADRRSLIESLVDARSISAIAILDRFFDAKTPVL